MGGKAVSTTFVFSMTQVRHILYGLRKLREADPNNANTIDGTICWLKSQMVGKMKVLEPFMRNRKWIGDEIAYEQQDATDYHECDNPQCKKRCRGKLCVACWRSVLAEIHGEPEHDNCKSQ